MRREHLGRNSLAADTENGLKLCLVHDGAALLQTKGRGARVAAEVN